MLSHTYSLRQRFRGMMDPHFFPSNLRTVCKVRLSILMLAPRKTLWKTPQAAIDRAVAWCGPLRDEDVVVDLGCGDGTTLVHWAKHTATTTRARFVGIDIEATRITDARSNWDEAVRQGEISAETPVLFYCGNALQADVWKDATVLFLYLIPRGLRQIIPLLKQMTHPIRVVSYMAPLPGEQPVHKETVQLDHQPDARWPIYYYNLEPPSRNG